MFFFTPTVVFNFPQKTLPLNKKPSFLVCCDSQKTVHQNETNQTSLFLSSKFLFINLIFFIIKKIKNTSINLVLFLFIYFSIRGLKKKQKSKN